MKRIATALMATLIAAGSLVSAPAMASPGGQAERRQGEAYGDRGQRDVNRGDNGGRSDDRGGRRDESRGQEFGDRGDSRRGNYDGRYSDRRNDRYNDRNWRRDDRHDRYSNRNWRRGERMSAYDRRDFRPVHYRDHYRDAPRGYRYERNDRGDVLLIGIATGIIAGVILSGN